MSRFTDVVLPFTLLQEGGYSDDPQDPGGATDFGITLASWRDYTGNDQASIADLQAVTPDEQAAFYTAQFWGPLNGAKLPGGIDLMVFDHAVMAGNERSAVILQRCCGAVQDGDIGPMTIASADRATPLALISSIATMQEAYYRSLLGFARFGKGWLARLSRRQTAAEKFLITPAGA
jgi:lysozyme family protein